MWQEMRLFIVPFRIVLVAMENFSQMSELHWSYFCFQRLCLDIWGNISLFNFLFFLLVYINCKNKLVSFWHFHTWVNVLWPCSPSPSLSSHSSPHSFSLSVYKLFLFYFHVLKKKSGFCIWKKTCDVCLW